MLVDVIGKRWHEQSCKSFGQVHATSFEKAVQMVFANRLDYKRVSRIDNRYWIVEIGGAPGQIIRMKVWCKRKEDK